ncbi:chaplin [Streptomyces sp. NBC_01497]|uniref:chaplin n=1 Tax=Streptomyces sp. NBC_01497 TaxID=2903885 RepID=UPI002E318086|nr:chaplin [Streptomyces sp. NBC_01497]
MRIRTACVAASLAAVTVLGGAGAAAADGHGGEGHGANAQAAAIGSPGLLSGNVIQVPVHVPVNVCGNSINVIGLLNPAAGNACVNR